VHSSIGKMTISNHLLIICLILVGVTILVRTVAIAQHAYNVLLLTPVPGEASGPLMAAVASPNTTPASAEAHPVEKPRLVEHHPPDGVAENAPDTGSSVKRERPPQIASERHRKKVALRRQHRFNRNGVTFHRPWTLWW
jgi:hypothetical protein